LSISIQMSSKIRTANSKALREITLQKNTLYKVLIISDLIENELLDVFLNNRFVYSFK
jgi:hypothetical protein